MVTPKRQPTPKYMQPLPQGLTREQIIAANKRRIKNATNALERHANKKSSGRYNPEVRTSDWIRLNESNLINWTKSKHHENQVVAEQLSRIIFDVENYETVIPSNKHPTLRAIFDRLERAEKTNRIVTLTKEQRELLDKFAQ